jgi:hypothetical protein
MELDGLHDNTGLVTQMLSNISSAHMDEVGFEVDVGDVGLVGWNEIDAALQHPSFSGLRRVEVRVIQWPEPYTWDSVNVPWEMEFMPRCHASGVLHQYVLDVTF